MNLKRGTLVLVGLSMFAYTSATWAHELNVKGSIPLAGVKNTPLHSLAKISLSEAVAIADRESKGKVVEAMLGHESGYLTYTVIAASSDKTVTEFCIDAGNGQVLSRSSEKMAEHDHSRDE